MHMNYAGTYRNTPAHLVEQAAAENLAIVEDLVVNKEQRVPDMPYFSPQLDPASTADHLITTWPGVSHELLGTSGIIESGEVTSFFRGMQPIPIQRRRAFIRQMRNVADMAHDRALSSDMFTLSIASPIRLKMLTYRRVTGGCSAWQGRLHRGARFFRS